MNKRPGGELASRPLHFIWILDCSGSMRTNGKIEALNTAIREAIPHIQAATRQNPEAQVLIRALKFSRGAQWHIATPTPADQFRWEDLTAEAHTDLGKAMLMVAEEMKVPPMPARALPPVLVLISDGQPTDDFAGGLRALMAEEWGRRAVRMAVAVGQDADHRTLQQFIGNPELAPLQADNPEALVEQIRWASTVAIQASTQPMEMKPEAPESAKGAGVGAGTDSKVW